MNSKQRRVINRRLQQAIKHLQGNKEDMPRKELKQSAVKNREWRASSPATLGILLSILLGIPAFLGLRAHPSVSLEAPLDPSDVFSTPLVLSNDGLLALENVRIITFVISAKYENGTYEKNNLGNPYDPQYSEIDIGEKRTIPLSTVMRPRKIMAGADLALIVKFTPAYIPFWTKRRAFRFGVAKEVNGNFRFQQQPSGNALELYIAALEDAIEKTELPGKERNVLKTDF